MRPRSTEVPVRASVLGRAICPGEHPGKHATIASTQSAAAQQHTRYRLAVGIDAGKIHHCLKEEFTRVPTVDSYPNSQFSGGYVDCWPFFFQNQHHA
jgi:hypothetical protein